MRLGDGDARVAEDLRQLVDVTAGLEPACPEGVAQRVRTDRRIFARTAPSASTSTWGTGVMGRDGVTTFGSDDTVSFRREYDNNLDGVFETVQLLPASSAALAGQQIAPGLHQRPWSRFSPKSPNAREALGILH
jgi:hypothetical protein